MLLWTTIAWIYLHSRRNIIISLLLAISTLLTEYIYIIVGDSRLKQVFGSDFKMWSLNTQDDFPKTILIKVNDGNIKKMLAHLITIIRISTDIVYYNILDSIRSE